MQLCMDMHLKGHSVDTQHNVVSVLIMRSNLGEIKCCKNEAMRLVQHLAL